jgi:hypothetical protein
VLGLSSLVMRGGVGNRLLAEKLGGVREIGVGMGSFAVLRMTPPVGGALLVTHKHGKRRTELVMQNAQLETQRVSGAQRTVRRTELVAQVIHRVTDGQTFET